MLESGREQGSQVRFAVIEGNREWTEPARQGSSAARSLVTLEDVEAEANRRLRSVKLNEWRTREFVTGHPMPQNVRHFALQVGFAAQAISRLSPIPQDFDSDVYWPRALDR